MYQITITLHTTLTVSPASPSIHAADTKIGDVSVVRVPLQLDRPPVRTVVLTIPRRWFGVFADHGMGWLVWQYIPAKRLILQRAISHDVYETLAATPSAQHQALRITVTALPQSYPIRVAHDVAVHVIPEHPDTEVITRVTVLTRSLALDAVMRQFPTTYWGWSIIAGDVHERIATMLANGALVEDKS